MTHTEQLLTDRLKRADQRNEELRYALMDLICACQRDETELRRVVPRILTQANAAKSVLNRIGAR